MLKLEEWMDVHALKKEGHSIKAIVKLSGYSRNTVRKVLREKTPKPFQKPERESCLAPFQDYVRERFLACGLSGVRLLEEIRPMGYPGSARTLRRYLATLRPATKRKQKLTVRFETAPGQQAQADWSYCGRFQTGASEPVAIYAFVMVLSFSRMLYVEFTTSMNLTQLIRCHQNAFSFFGGWCQQILYDNMKQVKLDLGTWNPLFLDFCNHYGITPKTHQAYRARTKGKVERVVGYVKDNFLNGRTFADLADLNAQARHWLAHTANVRIHGTTGQRPIDLFEKEKLTAVTSVPPYAFAESEARQVDFEGLVRFSRSRYSVPPDYAGTTVQISKQDSKIVIRSGDLIIAEHDVAPKPGLTITQPEHVAQLWKLSLKRTREPVPSWSLTFDQGVATTPLSVYEEVAR